MKSGLYRAEVYMRLPNSNTADTTNLPEADDSTMIINKSGVFFANMHFIDVPALQDAADELEKLSKVPAMKDHEKIFFSLCYNLRHTHKPRAIVNLLADTIPHKRCWYYLRKWGNLGFYDYGVTEDLGWFELDKIPQRYMDIVKGENAAPGKNAAMERVADIIRPIIYGLALPAVILPTVMQALGDIAREVLDELSADTTPQVNYKVSAADLDALDLYEKTESGLLEED